MNRCICVELDNDIDDFVAYKYLEKAKMIDYVVLSPYPTSSKGLELLNDVLLPIEKKIIPGTDIIFVGGDFKAAADYVSDNKLEALIANGGFVGSNLEKHPLRKFNKKEYMRTFNFNLDIKSIDKVLNSKNIKTIILTGKNVCHDERNTFNGDFWRYDELLKSICLKYHVNESKLQHDLLAFKEGYSFYTKKQTKFRYLPVRPVKRYGDKGIHTEWGSMYFDNSHIFAAIFK